jgi:AraC-like DNA-binding protein
MATAEPMVIASLLQHVVDGVRERRLDPAPLLHRHHIPQSWLLDPYGEVPLRKYVDFMEDAAQLAACPDFGLQLARSVTPVNLGPVGLLFASSGDLGRALYGLAAQVGVVQERTTCELVLGEDTTLFRYRIEDERIREKRQEAEYTLGVTCQLIRTIAGSRWDPEEVHFQHPAPASLHAHAALFHAPVYFGQPINALILCRRDLDIRNPRTDERMAAFLLHHVTMMRRHRGERQSLADQVRSIVRNHLPSIDSVVNAEQAAKAAGLSARSMQRVLQKENSGFRAIKDAERRSLAQQYLLQTGTSITEVALMLGYSDPACFTRACRRWFGVSPRQVRRDGASA